MCILCVCEVGSAAGALVAYRDRVTPTDGPEPVLRSAGRETGVRIVVVVAALLSGAGVWAVWRVFVGSRTGQLLDQASFEGAALGRTRLWRLAEPVLDVISVPTIAGVLVISVVIALVRRRWLLAGQVVLLIAGANLTTQLLKYAVFDRPQLGVGDRLANTLPSGHTAAATSCAVALLLVVPRRFRAATAVGGALYVAGTGISTLIGAWHRPGDVVAGVLVVLAWVCIVQALGPAGSVGARLDHRRETTATTLLLAVAAVTGAAAGVAIQRTLAALDGVTDQFRTTGIEARSDLFTAYAGGALGIVAAVCAMVGVVLLLLRVAEPRTVHTESTVRAHA